MSDSNTPDGEDDPVETIDRILARYPSSNPTINLLDRENAAERAFSKRLKQRCDKFKSERDAALARVKQADLEHEETVKMMRELIAERNKEIAKLKKDLNAVLNRLGTTP